MKKLEFANIVCQVAVTENYRFVSWVPCDYEKDTIAYAVESFFHQSKRFRQECTLESWHIRTEKSKEKSHKFSYIIPAFLMELPGNWVRLTGKITAFGVQIWKVELLREHPCFENDKTSKIS